LNLFEYMMFRRLLSTILATAFAGVSLLGHGGLHLLPGGHDCHGHTHASTTECESSGHSHAHADHAHGHCCSHSHSHSEATEQETPPAAPVPHQHDHDNCVVCQWHAQGKIATVDVDLPLTQDCCFAEEVASAQVMTAYRLTTLLTRGPPQLG
jgi:hypothetical protein